MKDNHSPFQLVTFPKPKYAEHIVAIRLGENSFNVRLFDAVEFFMEEDSLAEREKIFTSGKAKEFAEQFVKQNNAYPELVKALNELAGSCMGDAFEAGGHWASVQTRNQVAVSLGLLHSLGELEPKEDADDPAMVA